MFDYDFVDELNSGAEEGGLFIGGESQKVQQNFLFAILKAINPKKILEIGTHTANFCYFAKFLLPEVKIMTFGLKEYSSKAVDKVNEKIGNKDIIFVLGNSTETVPKREWDADFAWVDGGHDYKTAFLDLKHCAEKNIAYLALDDTRMPEVQFALVDFLKEFKNYRIVWSSPDVRGTVLLSNCSIEEDILMKRFVSPFLGSVSKMIKSSNS